LGALVAEAIAFKEKYFPGQGIRIGAKAGFGKLYGSLKWHRAHIDVLKPAASVTLSTV
jgi:ElaA protein